VTGSFYPPPPDHVPSDLIVDFDFFHIPQGYEDPAEIWRDLVRRRAPSIFYTRRNGGHWVFLNYEDVVEAYRNFDSFSTYQTPVPPMEPFPVVQPQGVDPPDHYVFRHLLGPMFTPAAVRGMTEEIQRRASRLIATFMDKGRCDFIADYASKLPTSTFLYLMGLPEERLPEFLELAHVFFRSTDEATRAENIQHIYAVLDELFTEKRRNPGEDIASAIVAGRDPSGKALPYQAILNCGFLLFVAGLDTVTNTMAYIWRYLSTTPQARAYFRASLGEPESILRAMEELFRINAVSNIFRRVQKDFVYKGIVLKRNDRIVLPNNIVNRDPAVFENPQQIDLGRKVNTHVTFGVGHHRCLGSHLAKREVMVTIQEWFARIPDFSLGADQSAVGAFGGSVMGFESLPLTWEVSA